MTTKLGATTILGRAVSRKESGFKELFFDRMVFYVAMNKGNERNFLNHQATKIQEVLILKQRY